MKKSRRRPASTAGMIIHQRRRIIGPPVEATLSIESIGNAFGQSTGHGQAIRFVRPGSPAEAAGLEVDDVLLAVNGAKYADNTEDECVTCAAMKGNWEPGSVAHYVVGRGGKKVKVDVTLGQVPPDVLAQWVGRHMLDHASVAVAQK